MKDFDSFEEVNSAYKDWAAHDEDRSPSFRTNTETLSWWLEVIVRLLFRILNQKEKNPYLEWAEESEKLWKERAALFDGKNKV
jgi:shikimate kinase